MCSSCDRRAFFLIMIQSTDQLGNVIELQDFPKRIVSIVPSQTELLFDLDLHDEVIGITKFCIHPDEWFRTKTRVGGTKAISLDKVRALQPDLIIGNKEENFKENIEELAQIAPIWMSDIFNLDDAIAMIREIGALTNRKEKSEQIANSIVKGFDSLKQVESDLTCSYYIWKNPYMVAGKNTFIDMMLPFCGLKNGITSQRYPELDNQLIATDVILLSSEPYPFKEADVHFMKQKFPNSLVKIVDGEIFSWYGSRLLKAPAYFQDLQKEINSHFGH